MPAMSAHAFATALHAQLDAHRADTPDSDAPVAWSAFLFARLKAIASSHGLWWAGRGHRGATRPRATVGEHREYLWDFTMYDNDAAGAWNLPQVVVEHENDHSLDAFRFDHWKTLCAVAPLRVAIGYAGKQPSTRADWVTQINVAAREKLNGWYLPSGTEDLIALGYYGMTQGDGNFRFWRRRGTETEWSPLERS